MEREKTPRELKDMIQQYKREEEEAGYLTKPDQPDLMGDIDVHETAGFEKSDPFAEMPSQGVNNGR